jgi:hypothetical protein
MKTKYTLLCVSEDEITREVVAHRTFELDAALNPDTFKRALNEVVDDFLPPDGRVTSSRPVVVVAVDDVINSRFREDAPVAPINGQFAQEVEVGQEFPSAIAASRHLGLKNNEVALYLQKTRQAADPAARYAKIRGVTIQYRDDHSATLLKTLRD